MPPHVLLLNGSLRGGDGNTGWLVDQAARRLAGRATTSTLHLADALPDVAALADALTASDAFVVATGVYWHAWGSPLQRFLEVMTPFENTACFLGKPAGVLVTMDSVGGAELAARLHGVLNMLGTLVPPCSTLVLSRVAVEAARVPGPPDDDPNDDTWQLADLDTVTHNVLAAIPHSGQPWRPWPLRALHAPAGAYPATGPLDLGSPRFLPPKP